MWFSVSLLAILAVQSFSAPTDNSTSEKEEKQSIEKCSKKYGVSTITVDDALHGKDHSEEAVSAAGCVIADDLTEDRQNVNCNNFEKSLQDTCNKMKGKLRECMKLGENPNDADLFKNFHAYCKGGPEI